VEAVNQLLPFRGPAGKKETGGGGKKDDSKRKKRKSGGVKSKTLSVGTDQVRLLK